MKIIRKKWKAFTLLEVLLVIAIIAVLAAIVIIAINPGKQMGESRNAQRRSDVNTVLNAVYQYSVDHNGQVPSGITGTATEICRTGGTCTGLVDLSDLTTNGTYLVTVPLDPTASNPNGVAYTILRSASGGRITVAAPNAELGTTISVTR